MLGAQISIAAIALIHFREPAARARLRGQLAGLATTPEFMAERGQLARGRRVSDSYLLGLLA